MDLLRGFAKRAPSPPGSAAAAAAAGDSPSGELSTEERLLQLGQVTDVITRIYHLLHSMNMTGVATVLVECKRLCREMIVTESERYFWSRGTDKTPSLSLEISFIALGVYSIPSSTTREPHLYNANRVNTKLSHHISLTTRTYTWRKIATSKR